MKNWFLIGALSWATTLAAQSPAPITVFVTTVQAQADRAHGLTPTTDPATQRLLDELRKVLVDGGKKRGVRVVDTPEGATAILEFEGVESHATGRAPSQTAVQRAFAGPDTEATATGTLVIGELRRPLTATTHSGFVPSVTAVRKLALDAADFLAANRANLQ